MLSVQNPASLSSQATMASAGISTPFTVGQPVMQMASPGGGLSQMASQASSGMSVPPFSLSPTVGVPTPFTQAVGTTTYQQTPMTSSVPIYTSPQATVQAPMMSPGLGSSATDSLLSTPLVQEGQPITINVSTPGVLSSQVSGTAAPMSLAERMMSLTPEQQEIEDIADRYLAEQGTEDQLVNFFKKYKNHKCASKKCALDGRYFYKVLAPYKGLVPAEMYIRVNIVGEVTVEGQGTGQEFWMGLPVFDLAELAATKTEDKNPRYRLIKLIIDISNDPANNLGSVHSNLIYIDTWKNEINRFEPMIPSAYTEPINVALSTYFKQLLPNYSYFMLLEHPQLPATDICPSKGMCAAYVLKKAMMLVTDNDRSLDRDPKEEEKKILVFADAIETEYGLLPEEIGERDQTGFSISLGMPGPYVSPYYYGDDWLYGPEYYGYRPHHRFARPWGWGWTHGGGYPRGGRWRGRGRYERGDGMETGRWEDIGRKLDLGWMRAKAKLEEYKERLKKAFRSDSEELEHRRKAHQQRVEYTRTQMGLPVYGELTEEQEASLERELSASRLEARPETGPNDGDLAKQEAARLQRQKFAIAAGSATVGTRPSAYGITKATKSYGFELGRPEYNWGRRSGCDCDGCHMAPPGRGYGSRHRDETGQRHWKSVSYGNEPPSREQYGWGQSVQTQGEMCYRAEEGCGCGTKPTIQMGAEHGRWSRDEYNQKMRDQYGPSSTTAGALIGGGAGLLFAGPIGAVAGAAAGGGLGYLGGKSRSQHSWGAENGDILRPSTWQRSTQTAVVGGLLGGGAGYLLGGGTGALIGAGAGGLGGYALGGGFSRPQHGAPRRGKPGEERISTPPGWPHAPPGHMYVAFPMGDREVIGLVPESGRPAAHNAPMNFIFENKTGVFIPQTGRPQYGDGGSTVAGALIGGGAGYLLGGGLSGVILGGALGGGAGYLLGRRGRERHYYPYRHRYWH